MKKFLALTIAAFALVFAVPQILSAADDAATIKKNMAERKPKIEVLKKAGSVGENKDGESERESGNGESEQFFHGRIS